MTRAEQLRNRQACHGATPLPVLQQAASEQVLPDPLQHQPLDLSRPWQLARRAVESVEQCVGKRSRQLKRTADETMKVGDAADRPGTNRPNRQREVVRRAVVIENTSIADPRLHIEASPADGR